MNRMVIYPSAPWIMVTRILPWNLHSIVIEMIPNATNVSFG
jgi:hypothetical protein